VGWRMCDEDIGFRRNQFPPFPHFWRGSIECPTRELRDPGSTVKIDAAILQRRIFEVRGVAEHLLAASGSFLDCEVVISTHIEYAVEFLTSKPVIQAVHVCIRVIETESTVPAVNQHVSTENAEFLVLHMRVTDDDDFHRRPELHSRAEHPRLRRSPSRRRRSFLPSSPIDRTLLLVDHRIRAIGQCEDPFRWQRWLHLEILSDLHRRANPAPGIVDAAKPLGDCRRQEGSASSRSHLPLQTSFQRAKSHDYSVPAQLAIARRLSQLATRTGTPGRVWLFRGVKTGSFSRSPHGRVYGGPKEVRPTRRASGRSSTLTYRPGTRSCTLLQSGVDANLRYPCRSGSCSISLGRTADSVT
jgi:hypothetical protein